MCPLARQRYFLDLTAKILFIKNKSIYMFFITIKNACILKDTLKKMKSETADREKIFAYNIPDKGIGSIKSTQSFIVRKNNLV